MKLFTMIALLFLIFATSGCALIGLEEEEEETETAETGSIDDLQGTWALSCTDKLTARIVISGTNYTGTATSYLEDPCVNPVVTVTASLNNLSPGTKTTLVDGSNGYFLTGAYTSITYTPLSEDAVTSFNYLSYCGINSWTINTSSEVSNKTCGDSVNPKLGSTTTGKYRISGNKLVSEGSDQQVTVYTKQ